MVPVGFIFVALVGSCDAQRGSRGRFLSGNSTSAGQGAKVDCDQVGNACCHDTGSIPWCDGNWLVCNDDPYSPQCVPCGDNATTCCSPDGRSQGAKHEHDFCKDKKCDDTNSCNGDPCGGEGQTCCQKDGSDFYGGSCHDGLGCFKDTCYKACSCWTNKCGDGFVCISPGNSQPNVCVKSGNCSCSCSADHASCGSIGWAGCTSSCYVKPNGGDRYCPRDPPFSSGSSRTDNCNADYEEVKVSGCEVTGPGWCGSDSSCKFNNTCACNCAVKDEYKIKVTRGCE